MRSYKGPCFQHRHYAEIANCIASSEDRGDLIAQMVTLFVQDNPNFDRGRFMAACTRECYTSKDERAPRKAQFGDMGAIASARVS